MSDILKALTEVDGVRAAAITTSDGLLVSGHGDTAELHVISAFGGQLQRAASRIAPSGDLEANMTVTVTWAERSFLLYVLRDETFMVVAMDRKANSSYVSYLLSRHDRKLLTA